MKATDDPVTTARTPVPVGCVSAKFSQSAGASCALRLKLLVYLESGLSNKRG